MEDKDKIEQIAAPRGGSHAKTDATEERSEIVTSGQTITVQVNGRMATLVVDKAEMTPRLLQRLRDTEKIKSEEYAETSREYLATVVQEWDVTDKQGEPVAPTMTGTSGLSYRALSAIMGAITAPKDAEKNDAGAREESAD